MNKPRVIKALLVLFASLTLASIISVYYTHQLPTEQEATTTLCIYDHAGKYDYTAKLRPNILYNQPTLKPGEGTLYTKITDHINITFTYTFTCNRPAGTSIEYQANTELGSPETWMKSFTTAETLNIFKLANTVDSTKQTATTTLSLNTSQVDELVRTIDGQIGTSTSQYNLMVKPQIHIAAEITLAEPDVRTIHETFAPSLTIEFRTGSPNYISIDNLEQKKPGTIDQTQTTPLPWVTNQRNISYAFCTATVSALAITGVIYIKTKPTTPPKPKEKPLKKVIKGYKELIAETKEEPPLKPDITTIKMATMEDLAKISEALMKPILYTQKTPTSPEKETTHTFYIIDNKTKYQYKTTAPTKT